MASSTEYSQSVRERKIKPGKLGLLTSPLASGGDSDSTYPNSTHHGSEIEILAGSIKHAPSTVTHAQASESGLSVPEPRDPPAVLQ